MRGLLANLPLKLASVGIAAVLWVVIAGQKSSERGLTAPLELRNLPRGLEVTGDLVNDVEVRLRASAGIIQAITQRDVSVQVDLKDVSVGERLIHLTPEAVRAPFGVRVVKINPSILKLRFEPSQEKSVPVAPRLRGTPAPGYEVVGVESNPAEVRVGGGSSRVDQVQSAFTEEVSVDGAKGDVSTLAALGLEDSNLRLEGTSWVRVAVKIRERKETRIVEAVPVQVRGGAALTRPVAVRVTLSGPASALDALRPADVVAFVAIGDTPLPHKSRVSAEIDPDSTAIEVVEVEPAEVSLRTTRKAATP